MPKPRVTQVASRGVKSPNKNVLPKTSVANTDATRQGVQDASLRLARWMKIASGIVGCLLVVTFILWKQAERKKDLELESLITGKAALPAESQPQDPPKNLPVTPPVEFNAVSLFDKASKTVVMITVFDASGRPLARGSGFFISADGTLVSNYHVIAGAASAVAKTSKSEIIPIVGARAFDPDYDLVILATEATNRPFLPLHSGGKIAPGTRIGVIGNPRGLEFSISEGIVSGTRQERDFTGERELLQITAPISHGSSGSPVLDASGNAIGIATLVQTNGQALNFAVPSDVATWLWNKGKAQSKLTPLDRLK